MTPLWGTPRRQVAGKLDRRLFRRFEIRNAFPPHAFIHLLHTTIMSPEEPVEGNIMRRMVGIVFEEPRRRRDRQCAWSHANPSIIQSRW